MIGNVPSTLPLVSSVMASKRSVLLIHTTDNDVFVDNINLCDGRQEMVSLQFFTREKVRECMIVDQNPAFYNLYSLVVIAP